MLSRFFLVSVLCFTREKRFFKCKKKRLVIKSYPILCVVKGQPLNLKVFFNALLEKADAIHLHAPNFLFLAALLLRFIFNKRLIFIITHHTDVFGRRLFKFFLIPLYKYLCRNAAAVIVYSKKVVNISEDLPKDCKLKIIPLSVDLHIFKQKKPFLVKKSFFTVGFLGRHARYKGIDVLLRACCQIPNCHVRLGGDGPYRSLSETLAKDLDMSSRAFFLGDIVGLKEKMLFFNSIDIFVFPSTEITETFGIVQLEAMMMGIPVIASNLPTGVTDIAIHEKTALLIRPGNVDDLVKAILRIKSDNRLRTRLIKQAKEHVRRTFDKQIVMRKTLKVFQDCLS